MYFKVEKIYIYLLLSYFSSNVHNLCTLPKGGFAKVCCLLRPPLFTEDNSRTQTLKVFIHWRLDELLTVVFAVDVNELFTHFLNIFNNHLFSNRHFQFWDCSNLVTSQHTSVVWTILYLLSISVSSAIYQSVTKVDFFLYL